MKWQDATFADIYPMLVDVAEQKSVEEDMNDAKRLLALGAIGRIDG